MSVQMPTREEMQALAEANAKAAKERMTLHKMGLTLRYISLGLMLASVIEIFHFHTLSWPVWLWIGIGGFVFLITAILIPHNYRFMILHATAAEAFIGVINSEMGSSQRILYVDQGEAALTELEKRYNKIAKMRKRFSFKKHERH